jgi:hypothetical protein
LSGSTRSTDTEHPITFLLGPTKWKILPDCVLQTLPHADIFNPSDTRRV